MNLLNRYLQAVGKGLPNTRRDDIIEELRANLLSQMDDREQEPGRPLTEDEQAEVLKRHGNPTEVAGRYREDNLGLAFGIRLIGPDLFRYYRTVLAIVLGITTVLIVVVLPMVARVTGIEITWGRALRPLWMQFIIVTAIFIVLDRGKEHWVNQWDPRTLPPVSPSSDYTIFDLLALAVGTLWLALTPHWPYLVLGPGTWFFQEVPLKLMSGWIWFYWAIIALLCAQIAVQSLSLSRLLSRRPARIADIALKGAGLCIGILLLLAGPDYVTSEFGDVADWANLSFRVCILVALAINAWGFIRRLKSLIRERHQMLPARQY
jgi:hypothetical protein